MVIVALYGGCRLLEADVVEPGEGSAADVFDRVVRDQELLLHRQGRKVGDGHAPTVSGPPCCPPGGSKVPPSPGLAALRLTGEQSGAPGAVYVLMQPAVS